MKNLVLLFVGVSFAFSAMAQTEIAPGIVSQKPEYVFVPSGFDDNDNAQVILDGAYPSSCYRSASPEVSVDHVNQVIRIKNRAYLEGLSWCAMTLVPYTEVVDLGKTAVGKYSVEVANDKGNRYAPMGVLNISASRQGSQPDDRLYAPIEDAFIQSGSVRGSNRVLILRGRMSNTCMKLKEVMIHYTEGKVIEVLPIAYWTDHSGAGCAQRMVSFEKKVVLKDAPAGRNLIHVRSLNGKAINKVVDIE